MAKATESKFLKFQDRDNDGLIDVCDPEIVIAEVPCKAPCTPNPAALIPDWKTREIDEPFLNEKKCLYQVTKVTRYTDTAPGSVIASGNRGDIDAELKKRFDEFPEVNGKIMSYKNRTNKIRGKASFKTRQKCQVFCRSCSRSQ